MWETTEVPPQRASPHRPEALEIGTHSRLDPPPQAKQRGNTLTTTGDVKHPRLDRFTYKPARHRGKAIDRTVAKINSQKLPSAISALTRDVRERLKT